MPKTPELIEKEVYLILISGGLKGQDFINLYAQVPLGCQTTLCMEENRRKCGYRNAKEAELVS